MHPKFIKTFALSTDYINEPKASLFLGQYMSGGTNESWALMLADPEGENLMVATVNLIAYDLIPIEGHVFIKNWGENAGILNALIREGVIGGVRRQVEAGYAMADECELLVDVESV